MAIASFPLVSTAQLQSRRCPACQGVQGSVCDRRHYFGLPPIAMNVCRSCCPTTFMITPECSRSWHQHERERQAHSPQATHTPPSAQTYGPLRAT